MANKKHSASSKRWLKEHVEDPYVHEAQKHGYRSRAVFKLEDPTKDKLIRKGMTVVDLGAAPGVGRNTWQKKSILMVKSLPVTSYLWIPWLESTFCKFQRRSCAGCLVR